MSGWSTVTIKVKDVREPDAFLETLTDVDGYDERRVEVSNRSVVLTLWGYDKQAELPRWLADRADWWERAVVLNANDTTDSGVGHLHKTKKGDVIHVDSESGAEVALGRDVVSYFQKEHDISCRVRV